MLQPTRIDFDNDSPYRLLKVRNNMFWELGIFLPQKKIKSKIELFSVESFEL